MIEGVQNGDLTQVQLRAGEIDITSKVECTRNASIEVYGDWYRGCLCVEL